MICFGFIHSLLARIRAMIELSVQECIRRDGVRVGRGWLYKFRSDRRSVDCLIEKRETRRGTVKRVHFLRGDLRDHVTHAVRHAPVMLAHAAKTSGGRKCTRLAVRQTELGALFAMIAEDTRLELERAHRVRSSMHLGALAKMKLLLACGAKSELAVVTVDGWQVRAATLLDV